MRLRRAAALGVLMVGAALLAAGCAIPTQSAPSTMAPSKVPFDLLDPRLARDSVYSIAARWGLPDAAHFSRIFKAAFDCRPSDIRG